MNKPIFYSALVVLALGSTSLAIAKDGHHRGDHKGKMFERMDTDGDGIVTKEEALSKAEERFSSIDADGDGKVTKEEAKAHHEAMREKYKGRRDKWRKKCEKDDGGGEE